MKKIYSILTLIAIIVAVNNSFSQSMSEDFESYTVNSYMGVNSADWTTWSGSTGGAEDVQVTDLQAASGSNSIYFYSDNGTGGPQDVVVPFGGSLNSGTFNFNANFYVESNRGAYFNFQGETTLGNSWSMNCYMESNGDIRFDDGVNPWVTFTFPHDTWFNLEIDIDLNTNTWEILLDGVSQGYFQSAVGKVASLDVFPLNPTDGNDISSFYMDDVNYTHTPFTLPTDNGAVSYIDGVPKVAGGNLTPTVTVRNLGTSTITSFDVEIDYNGSQMTENITGVSIPSMGEMDVDFTNTMTLVPGAMNVTATISNVNGNGTDNNPADDSKFIEVDPVVPATGKMVVAEEGTGTWCGWCPRGTVMMDKMNKYYSDLFAGIAVHNGDPMTHNIYDAGMGGLIGGYPSGLVDRQNEVDPSEFEAEFLDRITVAPNVYVSTGATLDSQTDTLRISVTADFQNTVSGTWKFACVITEDSLTGTTGGWAQANYYSGGGNGEMGGYELLPNPVPANQMVYDHVARVIMPDFDGYDNSFPTTDAGDVHTVNFELKVPSHWNLDNTHIIGMVIDNTGEIDNASKSTFVQAQQDGFIDVNEDVIVASVENEMDENLKMKIYPNPATDVATISIPSLQDEEVIVEIYDINGKQVGARDYGQLSGAIQLPINTSSLESGVYMIKIKVSDNFEVKKLMVE